MVSIKIGFLDERSILLRLCHSRPKIEELSVEEIGKNPITPAAIMVPIAVRLIIVR